MGNAPNRLISYTKELYKIMKMNTKWIMAGLIGSACMFSPVFAQSSASEKTGVETHYKPGKYYHGWMSSEDQAKFKKARDKVLASDADLKSEEDSLIQQQNDLHKKWEDHMKKMRAAMIKDDPSLKPVFEKMDKKRAEMKKHWDECKSKK
jgi:hypothetical protein